jgi:hypothetical protein
MHAAPHALCDLRLALPASASLDPYTRRPVHSVAHARLARRTRDIQYRHALHSASPHRAPHRPIPAAPHARCDSRTPQPRLSTAPVYRACLPHLPTAPVSYTCLPHLSTAPVSRTCLTHLSTAPVYLACLPHLSTAPAYCTCLPHMSTAPVYRTCLPHLSRTPVSRTPHGMTHARGNPCIPWPMHASPRRTYDCSVSAPASRHLVGPAPFRTHARRAPRTHACSNPRMHRPLYAELPLTQWPVHSLPRRI